MDSQTKKRTFYPALFTITALAGSLALGQTAENLAEDLTTSEIIESSQDNQNSTPIMSEIDEVLVTGSRIRRTEFNSLAPIEVISIDSAGLSGLLSATDILQSSNLSSGTQIDDSFGGYVTDGGPGANQVSLRGLGAQRTLVLINGKRVVPSGHGGSLYGVDLTSIPSSALSTIEIYKDGASPIYGADAVAGVINGVTRATVDEARLNVAYRHPEINAGQEQVIDGIWGKIADNWSVNISGSYKNQKPFVQADTSYAQCPTRPRLTDQDANGTIDNRHPQTGEELCFGAPYGFAVSPFGWARYDSSLTAEADASNPNYDPLINGRFGIPFYTRVPQTALENSGPFYRDSRRPMNRQVRYGTKNYQLNSQGGYDFALGGNSATAYYEAYFSRRETTADTGSGQFFPVVPSSNPSNPFGTAGPLGEDGRPARPVMMRWGIDQVVHAEVDRFNLFTGLRGSFAETWTYDTYLGYGKSDSSLSQNQLLDDRITASLDAVRDTEGNLVCRDAVANPGCVAVDLFTEEALLNGNIDPDGLNYLMKMTRGNTTYDTVSLSGSATGELFDMPAGPANGAFGFEYRRDSINDQPDIESQNGNIHGYATSGVTKGSDTVLELFGEFETTLVKDAFLAKDITANLASRWTDYDSYGSDTTWAGRLGWQIIPSILVKGTIGTSFRAPALFEQHLESQTGFVNALSLDPCWGFAAISTPGNPIYDNCLSQVGVDFGTTGGLPSIEVISGGAEGLRAETSDSYTYGLTWEPEMVDLSFAVTRWSYRIEDTVIGPTAFQILSNCYASVNFSHPFCARVSERNPAGELGPLNASFINIGEVATKGYDLDFNYQHEFDRFDLAIESSFTRQTSSQDTVLGVTTRRSGRWAYPSWKGTTDITVSKDEWTARWHVNFIGASAEDPQFDPDTTTVDRITHIGSKMFHNLTVQRDTGDWKLRATLVNLFDDMPPMIADGSGSQTGSRTHNTLIGAGYPMEGRSLILRATYDF